MIEAVILAVGVAGGADLRLVGLAAGAVWAPGPALVATAVTAALGWRAHRRALSGAERRFVEVIVGELRAGSSARAAAATACTAVPELDLAGLRRRLEVGLPLDRAVEGLSERLAGVGPLVAAALGVAASGGRLIPVFEEVALLAADEEEAAAEVSAATAQVRASMVVMVGAPLAYLAYQLWTGRLGLLLARPGGGLLAAVGGALFLAGAMVMGALLRRRRSRPDELVALAGRLLVLVGAGLPLVPALSRAALASPLQAEIEEVVRRARRLGSSAALIEGGAGAGPLLRQLAHATVSGAPLEPAIRSFLERARRRRHFVAIEAARRLPVRLMIPMTLLVLPGFVLMIYGPAVLDLLDGVLGPLGP